MRPRSIVTVWTLLTRPFVLAEADAVDADPLAVAVCLTFVGERGVRRLGNPLALMCGGLPPSDPVSRGRGVRYRTSPARG